jgi:cobalamin biosynthesis Mg chelatase CobN
MSEAATGCYCVPEAAVEYHSVLEALERQHSILFQRMKRKELKQASSLEPLVWEMAEALEEQYLERRGYLLPIEEWVCQDGQSSDVLYP